MSSRLTIIVAHPSADAVAAHALAHLERLAEAALVRTCWIVDASVVGSGPLQCKRFWAGGAPVVGDLLAELASSRGVEVTHVVTIATEAVPADDIPFLREATEAVVATLRSYSPAGSRFVDARLISPLDLYTPSRLTSLFSPAADANLCLLPETRATDDAFARPVSMGDQPAYGGHVAVELVTQAGLWQGMPTAPIEEGTPGVTGIGSPKVVIARSFAALALGPPLPLEEALTTMQPLPVPEGTEPAHAPAKTATTWANQIFNDLPEFAFDPPEPYEAELERMGVGAAVGRIAHEMRSYVQGIPRRLREGISGDVQQITGEAIRGALGADSSLDVQWHGRDAAVEIEPAEVAIKRFKREVASRRGDVDTSGVSAASWLRLVASALGVMDGGAFPGAPQVRDGQREVVTDPAAFSPEPARALASIPAAIGATPGSMIGRLASAIENEAEAAESLLAESIDEFERSRRALDVTPGGVLGVLNWLVGCTAAALLTAVVILSGLAEAWGLAEWLRERQVGWLRGASLVAVALAAVSVLPLAFKDRPSVVARVRKMLPAMAAIAFMVIVLRGVSLRLRQSLGVLYVGDLTMIVGVLVGLIWLSYEMGKIGGRRGGAASRALGSTAVVYLMVATVLGLVRSPDSWYARLSDAAQIKALLWSSGLLGLALVCLMLGIAWMRLRERLRIGDAARRKQWAERTAFAAAIETARLHLGVDQFLVTAAALMRLVWWPFGPPQNSEDLRAADPAALACALSLRIMRFDLNERSRNGLLARVRHEVARPGWLQHQYDAAVHAFRPVAAYESGRSIKSMASVRPEYDPRPAALATASSAGTRGLRQMFTEMLYDGALDRELLDRVDLLEKTDVFSLYFEPEDSQNLVSETMSSFGMAIVAGHAPHLPAQLFDRMPLPTGDDPRAKFSPSLWWPTAALPAPAVPAGTAVVESVPNDSGAAGVVIPFIRSDWSMEFALDALPIAEQRITVPQEWKVDDSGEM